MPLWNVHPTSAGGDGPWWNAPPERMFEAYYMTLRVHYGMLAQEALARARENRTPLGIGQPGGFIGKIRTALQGRP